MGAGVPPGGPATDRRLFRSVSPSSPREVLRSRVLFLVAVSTFVLSLPLLILSPQACEVRLVVLPSGPPVVIYSRVSPEMDFRLSALGGVLVPGFFSCAGRPSVAVHASLFGTMGCRFCDSGPTGGVVFPLFGLGGGVWIGADSAVSDIFFFAR